MQGSFNVWTDHKKGHNKVKDLARFKPMQRHLFLYNKMILFCKKREENSEGHEKSPSYSFKHSLKVRTLFCLWFNLHLWHLQTGIGSWKQAQSTWFRFLFQDNDTSQNTKLKWSKTQYIYFLPTEHKVYFRSHIEQHEIYSEHAISSNMSFVSMLQSKVKWT